MLICILGADSMRQLFELHNSLGDYEIVHLHTGTKLDYKQILK